MRKPGLHYLRYRKNAGTSCLLVLLCVLLLALLGAYWLLNKPDFTPETKAQAVLTSVEQPIDTLSQKTAPAKAEDPVSPEIAYAERQARMLTKGDYLLIEKSKHLLHHYLDGKLLKSYSVALGKNPEDKAKEGDNATPEGHFEVNFIKDSSAWTHDFSDGKGEVKGAYGPFFIALYTGSKGSFSGKTWRGIGIHGTHDPASIGTNASEGCIRLHNEDLSELKKSIEGKTRVQVDIIK